MHYHSLSIWAAYCVCHLILTTHKRRYYLVNEICQNITTFPYLILFPEFILKYQASCELSKNDMSYDVFCVLNMLVHFWRLGV